MKFFTLGLLSILISLITTPVYAETIIKNGDSNVSIKIDNNVNSSNSYSSSNTTNSHTNISVTENGGNTSVQVNNNDFTISGTVKSVSGNNLNVSGQNINFDPGKLSTPAVGEQVTVKGTVQNSVLIATSITKGGSSSSVLGTYTTPKPTAIITTHPSQTTLPSSTPTSSPSPTPSSSPNPELTTSSGFLSQLKEIFDQVFSVFRNLI